MGPLSATLSTRELEAKAVAFLAVSHLWGKKVEAYPLGASNQFVPITQRRIRHGETYHAA